jgi:hypothetical protein
MRDFGESGGKKRVVRRGAVELVSEGTRGGERERERERYIEIEGARGGTANAATQKGGSMRDLVSSDRTDLHRAAGRVEPADKRPGRGDASRCRHAELQWPAAAGGRLLLAGRAHPSLSHRASSIASLGRPACAQKAACGPVQLESSLIILIIMRVHRQQRCVWDGGGEGGCIFRVGGKGCLLRAGGKGNLGKR